MSSIRDQWIEELKETAEFKAIADTEDVDFSVLENNIKDLLDDQFIETATEYGIARREKMLQIIPKSTDSLETRRDVVSFRWDNQLPYTYRKLEQQLDTIAPDSYSMVLVHSAYTLTITLELNSSGLVEAVQEVAQEMVPSNIVLSVELKFNTHEYLSQFSRGWLNAFTHMELRDTVIPTPQEGITYERMENFTHAQLEVIYNGN